MGILLDQQAIFESARLAFVRVADEVFGLGVVFRDKAPLHAGGEPRAATAAQPGRFDFVDQLRRLHALDDFLPRAITAPPSIGRQRMRVGNTDVTEQNFFHLDQIETT